MKIELILSEDIRAQLSRIERLLDLSLTELQKFNAPAATSAPTPTTKTRDFAAAQAIADKAIEAAKALAKKGVRVRKYSPRGYYPDSVTPYHIFKLAGWDHLEVGLLTAICHDRNIPLIELKGHSSYRIPNIYVDALVKVLQNTMPRNPEAKSKIIIKNIYD